MADFTPTPSQLAAIRTTGRSVLVSAGAGSGKTAVLALRCAYLMADARPACPADRLLVVTFTEAAAAEMRERIGDALRGRLAASPTDGWLQRQLAMLETASISTVHAFCRQVLNRYFAQAGLDPQSPVMDPDDATLLRQETARAVFDRFADRGGPAGEAFLGFLAAYGGSGEQGLIQRVLAVDAFLNSTPDPQGWMAEATERLASGEPGILPDFWATALAETLETELAEQLEAVRGELAVLHGRSEAADGFAACLEDYQRALEGWGGRSNGGTGEAGIDDRRLAGIRDYAFPTLPRLTPSIKKQGDAAVSAFKTAQERVKRIRDVLFKKRLRDAFGRFTAAEWAEGIVRTHAHVETFLSLVEAVRKAYQAAKREQGVVDFADLERMTLDLLRNEEAGVAVRLRDRYEQVLVDEFQDVNPVQAEILRLVSRECESGRAGNLFAVGDVKQSIYRFRLAEPRLFLERRDSFASEIVGSGRQKAESSLDMEAASRRAGKVRGSSTAPGIVIDLLENFRSEPRVIDAINAVFERLMAPDLGGIDYDEHARLKAGLPGANDAGAGAGGAAIELHVLDDVSGPSHGDGDEPEPSEAFDWERIEREAYVIARRIDELSDANIPYSDIVILLRSMQPRAGLLLRTLWQLGIPVFADSFGGFFDALEVLDVLSLLTLLDNQQQDIPLAAVLRSPLFGRAMTDDELVEIRTAAGGQGGREPFHAAVRDYVRQGRDEHLRMRLAGVFQRLHAWRQRVRRRPLADVLSEIFEESGCLAYVAGLGDGEQRRANLLRLHEYARQFGTFQRQGLYRFLQFIHGLQDAGEDLNAGSVVSPSQDVVRVMTIHRSKGLEFPVVILGELGKRFNLGDARGSILFDRRLGIAMEAVDTDRRIVYPTLPHRIVSRAAEAESLAEELRVLYVALSRAKQRLVLVGTRKLSALEEDRRRYAGYQGPLPVTDRRTAQGMLDWVSAAICCQPPEAVSFAGDRVAGAASEADSAAGGAAAPLFEIRTYQREEMGDWVIEPPQRAGVADRLLCCSRMEPLEDVQRNQAEQSAVSAVARRLTTPYPAQPLTRVPAVVAASVLKRRWDVRHDDEQPAVTWLGRTPDPSPGGTAARPADAEESEGRSTAYHDNARQAADEPTSPRACSGDALRRVPGPPPEQARGLFDRRSPEPAPSYHHRRLREPAFLGRSQGPDSTSRGTWTHEFLQRVDLRRRCDVRDLRAQRKAMVNSGTMLADEAAGIDLDDVAWFLQTPLGERLRSDGARVLCEWPFVMGADPARYDPSAVARDGEDMMLVRGIVDCLFDAGEGWEILDYKTDAVTGDALAARAAEYHGQLDIYAAAVESIWQCKVTHRWLAFLSAREIVEV